MVKARMCLQAILLTFYVFLIFAMLGNIIYDFVISQKNEILLASIFALVFTICFISGMLNVFYYKKISKLLYLTFMFYLLLPLTIPLMILEIKYKNKINNENLSNQARFIKWSIIITTVLQTIELVLIFGLMLNFLFSNSQELITIGWFFLIPIILILFGLGSAWGYFLTNNKVFKILMIFNFQFGLPWFFLSWIVTNKDPKIVVPTNALDVI